MIRNSDLWLLDSCAIKNLLLVLNPILCCQNHFYGKLLQMLSLNSYKQKIIIEVINSFKCEPKPNLKIPKSLRRAINNYHRWQLNGTEVILILRQQNLNFIKAKNGCQQPEDCQKSALDAFTKCFISLPTWPLRVRVYGNVETPG